MIVDEITVKVKAGNGGYGKVSFGKMEKSGPDGGNGGKGGDVYFQASSDLTLLRQFLSKPLIRGNDGGNGDKQKMTGADGDDLLVNIPIGSWVKDLDTGEDFELTEVGEIALVAKGGEGGKGNWELRSPTNTTPLEAKQPEKGEERHIKIILRFLADYGLIGLPSAGKSSLLNELTNAKAKTGAYHFTTLSPNLGVLPGKQIIADIPGLIEGASKGKGLGTKFLKHIQKVKLLLHCIAADSEEPIKDYEVIRKELGEFDKALLKKKEIILITKSDLVTSDQISEIIKKLKKLEREILVTSIYDLESIEKLLKVLK